MRIVEFRIPVPVSLEDYPVGQLYNVARASLIDQLESIQNKTMDGLEFLLNEQYKNELSEGQYSEKVLKIQGKFPKWIHKIIDPRWFNIKEKSWNSFPTCITEYSCELFPSCTIKFYTEHKPSVLFEDASYKVAGVSEEHNAAKEVIVIDIFDEAYKTDVDFRRLKLKKCNVDGFGKDWMNEVNTAVTAYKLFVLDLPFAYFQATIEDVVITGMKGQLVTFHRNMVESMDIWTRLTIDDIRIIEQQTRDWLQELQAIQHIIVNKTNIADIQIPESRDPDVFRANVEALMHNKEYRGILTKFDKLVKRLFGSQSADENTECHIYEATHIKTDTLEELLGLGFKAMSTEYSQSDYTNYRDSVVARNASDFKSAKRPDLDIIVWKLSQSWMANSWSRRLLWLRENRLCYFATEKYPCGEDLPRAELVLDENTSVQYSNDEDVLCGRKHGVIISNPFWTRKLILSGEMEHHSRILTVHLQLVVYKISNDSSNNITSENTDLSIGQTRRLIMKDDTITSPRDHQQDIVPPPPRATRIDNFGASLVGAAIEEENRNLYSPKAPTVASQRTQHDEVCSFIAECSNSVYLTLVVISFYCKSVDLRCEGIHKAIEGYIGPCCMPQWTVAPLKLKHISIHLAENNPWLAIPEYNYSNGNEHLKYSMIFGSGVLRYLHEEPMISFVIVAILLVAVISNSYFIALVLKLRCFRAVLLICVALELTSRASLYINRAAILDSMRGSSMPLIFGILKNLISNTSGALVHEDLPNEVPIQNCLRLSQSHNSIYIYSNSDTLRLATSIVQFKTKSNTLDEVIHAIKKAMGIGMYGNEGFTISEGLWRPYKHLRKCCVGLYTQNFIGTSGVLQTSHRWSCKLTTRYFWLYTGLDNAGWLLICLGQNNNGALRSRCFHIVQKDDIMIVHVLVGLKSPELPDYSLQVMAVAEVVDIANDLKLLCK